MPDARAGRQDPLALIGTLYDEDTRLPGPALFFDRVERAARLARREGSTMAVAVLRLELAATDAARSAPERRQIMAKVARQLASGVRDSDSVGVIGDYELGLILPSVAPARLEHLLERALGPRPLEINTDLGRHRVGVIIGVGLRSAECVTADCMMVRAWENLERRPI